jgi:hypothetical protein
MPLQSHEKRHGPETKCLWAFRGVLQTGEKLRKRPFLNYESPALTVELQALLSQ